MNFLALIIAVVLDRLSDAGQYLRRDGWFDSWCSTLRGLGIEGPLVPALSILGPAVLAQLLLAAFQPALFGLLWIGGAALILLYSFGRGNLGAMQERFRSQCRREDFEGAWLTACARYPWLQDEETGGGDPALALAAVQREFLYEGCQRWFAVVFYFLLLGPAGALAYRLCHLAGGREDLPSLMFVVDWLPARALAATFSVTGNFVASVDELWAVFRDSATPAPELLYFVAMAAAGEDRLERDGPGAAARNEALSALLRRASVCWVVVISLLVVLG